MGLMDKLKEIFTEEVEEEQEEYEEPITKEVIQVEIPAPLPKEEMEEEEEKEVKKEAKPAPIFFDDNDFAGLEPPKIERQKNKYERPKKVEEKKEEKKIFKPTPIISPVYGVLDKNYHKEDIKTKNNSSNSTYYNHKDMDIDDIRKKAYGTLEDELEVTLFGKTETKEDVKHEGDIDMFDELMDDKETKAEDNIVNDNDLFNLIDSMYEKDDANGDS